MTALKTVAAGSFLALAFVASAGAQGAPAGGGGPLGGIMGRGAQPRGLFNPVVGSGAQYEMQRGGKDANGKEDTMVMEIDVVGKELVNGKDGYWFETTMPNTPMGEMVMKMLSVPDGTSITISKTIMQMAGHPPMEMPQMGSAGQQKQTVDIRDKADNLGSESVTTPAGTFTADHYRMKDGSGDFWLSDKVSPYGLIKGQGKDFNMVLTKVVRDAKDKITGTPVPFNPREMMQGMRPQ
jgi:hypothetical protein